MWLCLILCTDRVMNGALFNTVYKQGTYVAVLKLCTDWVINVAVFNTVYRRDTECGCV